MFQFHASGLRDYACPPWEHHVIHKTAGPPKLWVPGWGCVSLAKEVIRSRRDAVNAMIDRQVVRLVGQMKASRGRMASWLFTQPSDCDGGPVSIRSFLINPRRPEAIR